MNHNDAQSSYHGGNGSAGGNGHPAAGNGAGGLLAANRVASNITVIPAITPDAAKPPQIEKTAIFAAIRRKWFLAALLGLLVGVPTAAAVWFFFPVPYRAFAQIYLRVNPPRVIFDTKEERIDFDTYKRTQARLMKSPFVLAAALRKPGVAKTSILQQQSHPVAWLEENLEVRSIDVEFMEIALSGEQPREIAAIVNAVYDSYLEEVVKEDLEDRRRRKADLEDIQREIEEKMRTKDLAIRKLAEALGAGSETGLTALQKAELERMTQISQHYYTIQYDLLRAKTALAARRQVLPGADDIQVDDDHVEAYMAQVPAIQDLMAEEQRALASVEQMRKVVKSDDNPYLVKHVKELEAARVRLEEEREKLRPAIVAELRQMLTRKSESSVVELEKTVELLQLQEEQLRGQLDTQEVRARKVGLDSFELNSLRNEIEKIRTVADTIGAEIQRLDVELGAKPRTTGYRSAEVPHTRDLSKKYKLTALAGFGAFGLVIFGIIWLEVHARRISSIDEVVGGLSLRILGTLPIMPGWMARGKGTSNRTRQALFRSVWTESIDAARTILLRDARQESVKTLMICSAIGGEGKTTLACHLATSLARSGRKTLLIDTDMRRCSLHKVFGVDQSPGFSEVIRGEVDAASAIRPVTPDGLFLLTGGKINQATLQALTSDKPAEIFARLKEEFEFIVVDSAPLLPVTDSLLIVQYVDAALFSIRRDVSRYSKVAAACERLGMLGTPVLGAIVVGLDEASYGYRYPYRYGYHSYGGYGYHVPVDA